MKLLSSQRTSLVLLSALLAAPGAEGQSFTEEELLLVGGSPFNSSTTDNVEFGDVDLDGDWDVSVGNGGDDGNLQNRIWINQGGLQLGVVGTFLDETGTRFPVFADTTRDVEFADIDGDDDLDQYTANTAQVVNQGGRWWVNQGGLSGGSLGFFADETAARWIGLGGPGSSIAPTHLIPNAVDPETFIDWSCDADFGDLDADGHLDLVHSSYGGSFGGDVPTRLFLNDGRGFFQEWNPSGFQLVGGSIQDGDPGLWCEGLQQDDTTATDGSHCDIAASPEDVDLGDLDGDLDLDLLHGSVHTDPRYFENRLEESGTLVFRDLTLEVFDPADFPSGHAIGSGHYAQEMGDLDGDDDLDLFGINYQNPFPGFNDVVMENVAGGFDGFETLPQSGSDDQECDIFDFDNDGDLDLLVANFSGANRLYRNEGADSGLVFANASAELPVVPGKISMDIDPCDVDADGDYDFLEGNDSFANRFFVNRSEVPDTSAPRVVKTEAVVGHPAGTAGDRVRAQVYDNAPYLITYHNDTRFELEVDGVSLPDVPMRTAGGQLVRGELPGNLVGAVTYRVVSSDEYGNTGASPDFAYANTGPTGTLAGPTTSGPLGPPTLRSLTAPLAGQPLHLAAGNATPGAVGYFLLSFVGTIPGGLDLGSGAVLNVLPPLAVDAIAGTADGDGNVVLSIDPVSSLAAGLTVHVQCLLVDGAGANLWSSTQSLSLTFP